jgi:hypothetical protein
MMPMIFTTGAYLQPMKIKDNSGKEHWIWTVSEFVDDSFKNGEIYNPSETAEQLEKLLLDTTA